MAALLDKCQLAFTFQVCYERSKVLPSTSKWSSTRDSDATQFRVGLTKPLSEGLSVKYIRWKTCGRTSPDSPDAEVGAARGGSNAWGSWEAGNVAGCPLEIAREGHWPSQQSEDADMTQVGPQIMQTSLLKKAHWTRTRSLNTHTFFPDIMPACSKSGPVVYIPIVCRNDFFLNICIYLFIYIYLLTCPLMDEGQCLPLYQVTVKVMIATNALSIFRGWNGKDLAFACMDSHGIKKKKRRWNRG